ncbi:MAG: glycosyltransferase family 4 protein [Candidatus Ratteibacteria bacterium]
MKVLHIIDYLPDHHSIYGGAEIATLRLTDKLGKFGIKNFFITSFPDKNFNISSFIFPLKTVYNYIDLKNLKSWKNRILSIIDFYKIIFPFDFLIFFKCIKVLKKIKPDIVHFHNFKKLSFAPLIWAKILKIPSVLTIYDYWFFCPNETLITRKGEICNFFNSYKCFRCFKIPVKFRVFLPFRKIFFDFFLKMIDGYIFLSYSSLKIGKKYGLSKKKSIVIYQIFENFVEEEFIFPEENIILYIGWIQYRKGLHILIDALEQIVKNFRNVKLYIIGEIENVEQRYVKFILEKIKEKKLENYIKIIGKVPKEKVKEYIKIAKVVVIPEQWENMSPVVLVEAMFNKKAIVASRIGGIFEFIEDGKNGFLCEPKNSGDFAEKILKFLNDDNLVKIMGENSYLKAKEIWDNEKNIEKIIKFYKNFLKNEQFF